MQAFISLGRHTLALLTIFLVGIWAIPQAHAQSSDFPTIGPGTWQAYPSMNRIHAMLSVGNEVWSGTNGGVFRYNTGTGEIKRYTRVDGLAYSIVTAFAQYDGYIWIGYANGVLDRLDPETDVVLTFRDIERADRYPDRRINRIREINGQLYIATGFGIVVFDPSRNEVRDTYDAFGTWDRGIAAYDFMAAYRLDGTEGYWVATEEGLASAALDAPNLRVPGAWTIDMNAPSNIFSLGYLNGRVYAGRGRLTVGGQLVHEGDVYRAQIGGGWSRMYLTDWNVYDLAEGDDYLLAVTDFHVGVFNQDHSTHYYQVQETQIMQAGVITDDNRVWIGSVMRGIGLLPELVASTPSPITAEQYVVPDGPLNNEVTSVTVTPSGEVWAGYQTFGGLIDGVGKFDGLNWTHFSQFNGHNVPALPVVEMLVDSRGDFWGGSFGRGILRITSDEEVIVYNETNSTLRPDQGTSNFITVFGIQEDRNGLIWVTNRNAPHTLHTWDSENGWNGLSTPSGIPATNRMFGKLLIDRFDQKWVIIHNQVAQPTGFAVMRTGDPFDPLDDEVIVVNAAGSPTTGTGLPSVRVTALTEDLDGRIWIGTTRGMATVHSPGSVFNNPALAIPTWPRVPDQSSYFLRDLAVNVIRVDPAGRLWIGSSDGLWLINAAGNEVLAHYNSENSPLPSVPIVDIAIDPSRGLIYIATSQGLFSYRMDTIQPSQTAERLQVFPSPFQPYQDPFVRVEGLVAETRVRVLTVDGQVVASFEVRGGSVTWDGRDQRTGQMVPSGVYIVAAAGMNGEGTSYGKIAVIH